MKPFLAFAALIAAFGASAASAERAMTPGKVPASVTISFPDVCKTPAQARR